MKIIFLILFLFSFNSFALDYDKLSQDQKLKLYSKMMKESPDKYKIFIEKNVVYCVKAKYMKDAVLYITNNNKRVDKDYLTSLHCSWLNGFTMGFSLKFDKKRGLVKVFYQTPYVKQIDEGWFRVEDLQSVADKKKMLSRYD